MSSSILNTLAQEQRRLDAFTFQASAAGWIVFSISTIVFMLRTTAHAWLIDSSISVEDVIISMSWLFDVLRMVFFQIALSTTRKVNVLEPGAIENTATFWIDLTNTWAFLSVTLPKIGVAFLLVRIFRPQPWARNAMIGSSIGLFVIYMVGFILSYRQCNPLSSSQAMCWRHPAFIGYTIMASCLSATMDLAFTIDPGTVVWSLDLPMRKKLVTTAVMFLGFGSFAFAVAVIVNYAILLNRADQIELDTYALHIALWNSMENDLVLIVACLPGARFWFMFMIDKPAFGLSNLKSCLCHVESGTIEERNFEHAEQLGASALEIHVKQEFELHFEDVDAYLGAQDHALRVYDWARPQLRTTKTS